jgi:hypothetical protein
MESERKTRGRGRPRGGTLVEEQEWSGRLIARGVSNSQACRMVGIDRRTGTRWRYGRVVVNKVGDLVRYPAVSDARPQLRHPRYLSFDERTMIADVHREGVGVRGVDRHGDGTTLTRV